MVEYIHIYTIQSVLKNGLYDKYKITIESVKSLIYDCSALDCFLDYYMSYPMYS